MSNILSDPSGDSQTPATREEIISALFAHMVIQQTNMSMMLMGKVPHPQTGKTVMDIDSAKLLIDQLEMLEVKTAGNLSKEEGDLLKQALGALRMSFVEVVGKAQDNLEDEPATVGPGGNYSEPSTIAPPDEPKSAAPVDDSKEAPDDSRKRFSKKY